MKKYVFLAASFCTIMTMAGCGNKQQGHNMPTADIPKDTSKEALMQAVKAVEAKLKTSPAVDMAMGDMAITAYTNYAKYFPADTQSTAFLFYAAGLASSTGQYERAIGLYDNISKQYPTSRFVPECLLVEGFIYDNNLNDTAKAHKKYQELVDKFPNDSISRQAKQAIRLLGKSPEEIGKEFEEKNKSNKKART